MIDVVGTDRCTNITPAREGGAGFTVTSEEWLTKPGSVGKPPARTRAQDPGR